MRAAFFLTACFIGFTASGAEAQVLVLGNGIGSACWRAAEFGMGSMNEGFQNCTEALSTPSLSLRDKAGTYVNHAVIRLRAGDNSGALTDADQAIRMLDMGEAHVNRGAALINMMRPAEALQAINTGIEKGTTKMHLVLFNRASAKFLTGDVRGAYYDYRMAADLRPDIPMLQNAVQQFQVTQRPVQGAQNGDEMVDEIVALGNPAIRTR